LKNLEGAFYAIAPKELNGRRAILIDDVSTTGATIESCKWVLESAGAKVVAIGVVARVENKT
jgi:predicted amidophosphoribosyltransferase